MARKSCYQKVKSYEDRRRGVKGPKPRKFFDEAGGVTCKSCFSLRNENTDLKQEIVRLRVALKVAQKVTHKDVANAHTPSSKINYKSNSKEASKPGGAKLGHKGHGRRKVATHEADQIISIRAPDICQDCRCELNVKDTRERTIIESSPIVAKQVIYRVERGVCPQCFRIYKAHPPALPKNIYGNSLIAQAAIHHYVHGMTMGKVIELFGQEVSLGGLVDSFHRLGKIASKAREFLINDYRSAPAKHADETGWRTDGRSGYAWIFTTPQTTIFDFKDTRSAQVAHNILGKERLPGVLVVDRYGGYNKMPVQIQYCYAHLLREVKKLEEEFGEERAVVDFSIRFSELLSKAMKLRGLDIGNEEYLSKAEDLEKQIKVMVSANYRHLGIRRIQQIFTDQKDRLYHWVKSKEVPAENNRAERELRPTVIARKVSFGSQSDAGANTRSHIMSLLYTVKKRVKDRSVEEWLKQALDQIATNTELNIAELIPKETSTPTL